MKNFHLSALIGPATALLGFVLSPEFASVVPTNVGHGISVAGIAIGLFAPGLLKKKTT